MSHVSQPSTSKSPSAGGASSPEMQPVLITNSALHATTHVAEDRDTLIAKAAYLRAEQRGFAPDHELDDWLEAEAEVDKELMSSRAF
jgi:hypothetical protein